MPGGGEENGDGKMAGPTRKHLLHNPFVSCRTRVREALIIQTQMHRNRVSEQITATASVTTTAINVL